MTTKKLFPAPPFSLPEYIAVLVLLASAFAFLARAFELADGGFTEDQRRIVTLFLSLEAGAAGFLFGGAVVHLAGSISTRLSFVIRAVSGSALFVIVLLIFPLFSSSPQQAGTTGNQSPCELAQGLEVTSPSSESVIVGPRVEITGKTPYLHLSHAIVVTDLASGMATVQNSAVAVSPSGQVTGTATLGSSGVGDGGLFEIRIVASRSPLKPGPLNSTRDLKVSNVVKITRSAASEGS